MGLFLSDAYRTLNKAIKNAEDAYSKGDWEKCYTETLKAAEYLRVSNGNGDLAHSVYLKMDAKIEKMFLWAKGKKEEAVKNDIAKEQSASYNYSDFMD